MTRVKRPPGSEAGSPCRRRVGGFTLLELLVTLTVFGLLVAAAVPPFVTWIANSRVRAVTENLQNGLKVAQSEAIRNNRVVVFALTDDAPSVNATAKAGGKSWAALSVGLLAADAPLTLVQGGELGSSAAGVTVAARDSNGVAKASVCFDFTGRLTNPTTATGVAGEDCSTNDVQFNVTRIGADRPLRTLVNLAGQVRVCDPNRTLSATQPDGCP